MAISFKIRICYLIPEFLAHAHGIFGHLEPARTVPFFFEYAGSYSINYLFIFVIGYFHFYASFLIGIDIIIHHRAITSNKTKKLPEISGSFKVCIISC